MANTNANAQAFPHQIYPLNEAAARAADQVSYNSGTLLRPLVGRKPVERYFFLGDLVALSLSFVCGGIGAYVIDAYILNTPLQGMSSYQVGEAFLSFLVTGLLALLWLDTKGHYIHRLPYWESTSHLFTLALVGIAAGGFLQFSAKTEYSRLWLCLSWIVFAGLLIVGRIGVRRWLQVNRQWDIPTLVIGEGTGADAAVNALESERHLGYMIVDVLPPSMMDDLATPGSWGRLLQASGAQHLMLAIPDYKVEYYQSALQALVYERIPYSIVPSWFGLPMGTLSTHYFFTHGVAVLHNTNRLELMLPRFIKRSFDVLASGAALVALSPLMLIFMLQVKKDGGTAFYRHRRVGQGGREFDCLKFRSMVMNTDDALRNHLAHNPEARAEYERDFKLRNDPRITRIGKFLRATSLDELPQLINIFRGDMSLVGPRPIMAKECARYDSNIALYYMVRPGLTGLWQVSGRNDVSYADRVKMDSLYISNWSFWHDIAIILKTFPAVLKRRGVY